MSTKYSIQQMIGAIKADTIDGNVEVNDDGFITDVDITYGIDMTKLPGANLTEVHKKLDPLVKKLFINILTEKE